MDAGQLLDLDELVLRCRDDQARQYIAEAVACYKAGAFRSSIVATWIAVVFDFIYKLRELELTGDTKAKAKLEEFDRIRQYNDVTGALNFEKKILDTAKDEFQLLSPLEHTDLSRLLTDRNRCAHPSMNSIEDIYQPPAELARYHLRNAVSYLLQRPPVQGKAAIAWLLNEVNSVYFPISAQEAVKSFASGPLSRPSDALVRNFVVVLVKSLLYDDLDESSKRRYYAAINAVRRIHRTITDSTFASKLNEIFKGLPDDRFGLTMRFLLFVPDTWQYTHDDVRNRMNTYTYRMPAEDLVPNLLVALRIEALQKMGRLRLKGVSSSDLAKIIAADPKNQLGNEFAEIAVPWYEDADSYYTANYISTELLVPLVDSLSNEQIERIIKAGQSNDQVNESFEFPTLLRRMVESGKVNKTDMFRLLTENELESFIERVFPKLDE